MARCRHLQQNKQRGCKKPLFVSITYVMKNLRAIIPPKTESEYFEWVRGMPKSTRTEDNKQWMNLKKKIDSGYFDISFCFWGNLGRITKPDSSAPGNVFYIKYKSPICENIFKNFDTSRINRVSAGAPQITSDDLIRIFDEMNTKSSHFPIT
jgi:hypothetical protein